MSCCNFLKKNLTNVNYLQESYNTASGMSCCNGIKGRMQGYRPITLLQYRKRYELLQQKLPILIVIATTVELQYRKRYELLQRGQ